MRRGLCLEGEAGRGYWVVLLGWGMGWGRALWGGGRAAVLGLCDVVRGRKLYIAKKWWYKYGCIFAAASMGVESKPAKSASQTARRRSAEGRRAWQGEAGRCVE